MARIPLKIRKQLPPIPEEPDKEEAAEAAKSHLEYCNICSGILVLRWYRCLRCPNFRICLVCYDNRRSCITTGHVFAHPMQMVLTNELQGWYYMYVSPYIKSFTCPYCAKKGLYFDTLREHVLIAHHGNADLVNCCICYASPDREANPTQSMQFAGFVEHLIKYHTPGRINRTDAAGASSSASS